MYQCNHEPSSLFWSAGFQTVLEGEITEGTLLLFVWPQAKFITLAVFLLNQPLPFIEVWLELCKKFYKRGATEPSNWFVTKFKCKSADSNGSFWPWNND